MNSVIRKHLDNKNITTFAYSERRSRCWREFPVISSICLVSLRAKPLITTVKICMKYCSYFSATHQLNELLIKGELHPWELFAHTHFAAVL